MFNPANHLDFAGRLADYIDLHSCYRGDLPLPSLFESEEVFLADLKSLSDHADDLERQRDLNLFYVNYQCMSDEEIEEAMRLELEEEARYQRECDEEEAWQVWLGNPSYLSYQELKAHEVALDHEEIELSLMGL
jgi:hypothetical protein